MKLNPVVTIMINERSTCITGFAERSDGLKANGHSTAALNTMWPAKRSQVICMTGMAFTVTKYFAVASSSRWPTTA